MTGGLCRFLADFGNSGMFWPSTSKQLLLVTTARHNPNVDESAHDHENTGPEHLSEGGNSLPLFTPSSHAPNHSMNAAEIQTQLNSSAYFNLVSFSILFYDFFLTLDWEISRYWGTPVHMAGCLGLESYHQYFIIATQILVAAMLMLRTFALYERSKRVLVLMILVAAGGVAVGIWSVLSGKAVDESTNLPLYFGCNYPISRAQGLSLAAAWAGVAVFDCMIFLLTLYRVFSVRRTSTILTVLLRDGSIYFGQPTNPTAHTTMLFQLGTEYTRGIATTFTNIISSVMLTRLMLNLRDPALAHMAGRGTYSTSLQPHDIQFAAMRPRARDGTLDGPELDTDATMGEIIELQDRR
ncbi:hypothetical protein MSAN_01969000 [Mycena sanguinolenta]|uniref:Transmembrane protein n=1 Tax=Mycena sanguinolenta TaxID=230812 RepID=A0A8H6XMQ6_9AGAR|nr:hypothetical protein MSAN_01969000 [Mycena sanguinolenta]